MGSSYCREEALIRLTNQNVYLGESMNYMTLKIDELIQRLGPTLSTLSPTSSPLPPPSPGPVVTHRMKLEGPRFDGTEPLSWIFMINQFFEYHGTPEQDKLTIASFYMEGQALTWFQWMNTIGQFTSWLVFLKALCTRFAPSQYDDHTRAFCKLTQKGTVAQYLSEFEDLANRIIGLPSPFLLSCFISGLAPEIRR